MRCDVSTFPAAIAAGISAETTEPSCRDDANRPQQSGSERALLRAAGIGTRIPSPQCRMARLAFTGPAA